MRKKLADAGQDIAKRRKILDTLNVEVVLRVGEDDRRYARVFSELNLTGEVLEILETINVPFIFF